MGADELDEALETAIAALSESGDDALTKAAAEGIPDPAAAAEWVDRLARLLLTERDRALLRRELPRRAAELRRLLAAVALPDGDPARVVAAFVARLPEIRARLTEDVEAAYDGDPAARGFAEIVVGYPSIRAIATYRVAHALLRLGVPILPRILTEHAHHRTGIDIHPGAVIGRRFFIDHGTGVVIGETTEIGNRVRLYQGVTLGAKALRQSDALRGRKRHPTIEDDVTIYAGATILGGETTIGRGSVIGGNVWLIESVPEGSKVVAEAPRQLVRRQGRGGAPVLPLHWDI